MTKLTRECVHRPREDDELVCTRCGLVLGPVLVNAPPYLNSEREYGESPYQRKLDLIEQERVHDRGLGTELFSIDKKQNISPTMREWWNRLLHNGRGASYRERRLRELFCEIVKITSHMKIPRTAHDRMCWMTRKLAGKTRSPAPGLLADLVYIACRSLSFPRTLEEIDKAFEELYGESFASLRHGRVSRIHELARGFGFDLPPATAHDYVDRLAAQPEIAARVHQIADGLGHGNPVTVAKKALREAQREQKTAEKSSNLPPQGIPA